MVIRMFAVFKRDLRAFYTTPLGFVFSGVLILFMNLCFYYMNVKTNSSDIMDLFELLLIALAFLAPILTMRLLSEEKKLKTDQLLFTAPIKVTDIVLGKYFAAMAVFVLSLAGTFMITVVLSYYSAADTWAIFGNYVAIFFAASAFIAIGLFISSLTENQLIAALVTWAVLISLWLISMLSSGTEIVVIRTVINWISIFSRYSSFAYGLFSLSDILYYVSVSVIFVFLTVRMLDKKRYA